MPLCHSIASSSLRKMSECKIQCNVNSAWALSKLNWSAVPWWDALASASIKMISHGSGEGVLQERFDPGSISATAWAMSAIALAHRPLRDAISAASLRPISEFQYSDCANTPWAIAAR